jgi:hypothetical protein
MRSDQTSRGEVVATTRIWVPCPAQLIATPSGRPRM